MTSQESAVLHVGCRFLGGQPTSQDDANLHVKISKNSTSRCCCGDRQGHKDSQKTVGGRLSSWEYGDHQTRHLSKLGGG